VQVGKWKKSMKDFKNSRVVGLLGVGFDAEDGHIRITQTDRCNVLMGSGETHQALQKICSRIEEAVQQSGRQLSDYTPEEFMEMVQELY
jgi:hypothetical protein